MLKEAPNNNDYARSKYVLNEAPNRDDATGLVNNVCLTTVGATQFSMVPVYLIIIQKSRLTRDERYNDMKTAKVRADGNNLCPGKE